MRARSPTTDRIYACGSLLQSFVRFLLFWSSALCSLTFPGINPWRFLILHMLMWYGMRTQTEYLFRLSTTESLYQVLDRSRSARGARLLEEPVLITRTGS